MESRAETLRRQIAFYRHQLEAGVESELAGKYLAQILNGEAELRAIANKERDGGLAPGSVALDRRH